MKQVISTEAKPIKLWLEDIEPSALKQAKNLANLPFTFKHIALMPDAHFGYGMPIGSILATKSVVVPNAVGVDIGCGMCAVKTSLKQIEKSDLKKILQNTRALIPIGFDMHKEAQAEELMPKGYEDLRVVSKQYVKASKQLGTLGGGNHFIEIQKGSDDHIWVMIHSGSRNLGYKVAKYYNDLAIRLNSLFHSQVTKNMELAFLPIQSPEAKDYLAEMNYCVDFALANRKLMMARVLEAMKAVMGEFENDEIINESHNFAAWEHHFGSNVLVHRKGATKAYEGELGMIPGSQGTKSYIVKGLGNEQSYKSCSHGAGRQMGRKQAIRELSLEDEIAKLDKLNVVHSIRSKSDLDEAPSAYKDISIVMDNQTDLAEIVVELSPMAVLKG